MTWRGSSRGSPPGATTTSPSPFKKEEVLARIRTHLERTLYAHQLAELNAHLEQKVEERTRQLQLKVAELEGKDRIAHHLLTVHTLEETLGVVLEVVSEVLLVERAVLFLDADGDLRPAAAIGPGSRRPVHDPAALRSLVADPTQGSAIARMRQTRAPVRVAEGASPIALVPILREAELLGALQVEGRKDRPLDDEDLRTLNSFALQAAVAIHDARLREDPDAWRDQLDEVLEIEEELEGPDGDGGPSTAR